MDIIELLKSAFMGLVEGITEWLPVSSTGRITLVDEFVKMNVERDVLEYVPGRDSARRHSGRLCAVLP